MISHLMASDHIPAFGVPPPKVQPAEATALYIHDVAIVPEVVPCNRTYHGIRVSSTELSCMHVLLWNGA
jgi:hypothetical protein